MQHLVSPQDLRRQAKLFRDAADQCDRLATFLDDDSPSELQRITRPPESQPLTTNDAQRPSRGIINPSSVTPPPPVRPSTRIDQVVAYLKAHGPKGRGEIIQELNLPKGTVDMVLNRPEFKRDEEGRWSVMNNA